MVRRVARIEVTVVGSETDALFECNLIKAHRPRYNIIFRDDKTFRILCAPDHDFPRLQFWRGLRPPTGQLFDHFRAHFGQGDSLELQKVSHPQLPRFVFAIAADRVCSIRSGAARHRAWA